MSEENMTQTVELDAELEEIFTKLDALPLGRAAKLVKALEERWGVSAAAPAVPEPATATMAVLSLLVFAAWHSSARRAD